QEQAPPGKAAGLNIAQKCKGPAEKKDAEQMRPRMEVISAGQHRQQGEQHSQQRMEPRAQHPVADPGIQACEQSGRHHQDGIQPIDTMEQSEAALTEPGLGDPRITCMCETERIRSYELMRGKNPLADDDVPERAGIAKQAIAPQKHSPKPKCQK